jgi:hypothetical protein
LLDMAALGRIVVNDQNMSTHTAYRRTARHQSAGLSGSTVNFVLPSPLLQGWFS